jgi:hypothetical protein
MTDSIPQRPDSRHMVLPCRGKRGLSWSRAVQGWVAIMAMTERGKKSFLVLFFKKERLPSSVAQRLQMATPVAGKTR